MRSRPEGLLTVAKVLADNNRTVQIEGHRASHALIKPRWFKRRRFVVGSCLAMLGLTAVGTTTSGTFGAGADDDVPDARTAASALDTDSSPLGPAPPIAMGDSWTGTPSAPALDAIDAAEAATVATPPVVAGVPVVPAAAQSALPSAPGMTVSRPTARPSLPTRAPVKVPQVAPKPVGTAAAPAPAPAPAPVPHQPGLLGGLLSPVTKIVAGVLGL